MRQKKGQEFALNIGATSISMCTKLANILARKSRNFCHSNRDIFSDFLGLGLEKMSRFEWEEHSFHIFLAKTFASFVHTLIVVLVLH